ncbi:hypothetical protein [Halosimplex pelagicum]|uniref:Uncharacterized protein n=1 Tax=Halosimplex pelagicum TaxID=869886 RepID=A0A7D5P6T6_9EURY|nr:hypothetical protein [Halosimplex pelagicum]QLH82206.1 hypothetical protein HZS54_11570 [Halosimplex pelagicum]
MGEQPPVHGIHDVDRHTDLETEGRSVTLFYDPEAPDDALLQGDVLQRQGPSIDAGPAGPSIR